MIDTDKYEGELEYRMNKEFCNDIACGHMNKDLAIQYAHEFYSNSLELLAEVKRLREAFIIAVRHVGEHDLSRDDLFSKLDEDLFSLWLFRSE